MSLQENTGTVADTSPVGTQAASRGIRRQYTIAHKRQVVEELLTGKEPPREVARKHGLLTNQLDTWRRRYLSGMYGPPHVTAPPTKQQATSPAPSSGDASLELRLPKGNVVIRGAADAALIRYVIAAMQ